MRLATVEFIDMEHSFNIVGRREDLSTEGAVAFG